MKSRTKFLLFVFVALLLAIIFLKTPTVSSTRDIGYLNSFRIEGHNTHRTEYLTKYKYGRYVVQADEPTGRTKINLRTMILNSNGDWRAPEWGLTYEGTRNLHSNWASEGYYYAIEVTRQYDYDGVAYVSGSWSPDTRDGES